MSASDEGLAPTLAPGIGAHGRAGDAFDALAPWYDAFTSADNYDRWGELIADLARRAGAVPNATALDLACGTGKSTAQLLQHGYRAEGCDTSSAMLERAHAKPGLAGVRLFQADMRRLPPSLGPYGLVNCMDDAVNFLLTTSDLRDAFRCVRQVLAPGGAFIFDCNTLRTYRSWYAHTEVLQHQTETFVWRGHADAAFGPGQQTSADLYVLQRHADGSQTWVSSPHRQRHHPMTVVQQELRRVGLRPWAAFGLANTGDLDTTPDEEVHGKVIHVAHRPAETPPRGAVPVEGGECGLPTHLRRRATDQ